MSNARLPTIEADHSPGESPGETSQVTDEVSDPSGVKPDAQTNPSKSISNKTELLLRRLRAPRGVIAAMMEATGWQAHSMRGFLSGIVAKKLGRSLISEVGTDGVRRYRIASPKSEG
jgi:hypothetical protein